MVGIALALLGPGLIALFSVRFAGPSHPLAIRSIGLLAFISLLVAVGAVAHYGERVSMAEVGSSRVSWMSLPWAIALTGFFVFLFGPVSSAFLRYAGLGSFEAGIASLSGLPLWYLVLTISVVAAGEEWLYRGYAIERLAALSGSVGAGALISLIAFAIAHVPLWGVGPSLTTLASGAVMTALYVWRRDVSFLVAAHVATDLVGLVIAPIAVNRP